MLGKIAATIAGGAGLMAGPVKLASMTGQKKLDAKKREDDAEMKRESRGVAKPANFDAIEEAKAALRGRGLQIENCKLQIANCKL